MKIVIPSRRRSEHIGKRTLSLFPEASVCVEDSEVKDYQGKLKGIEIIPHPPLKSLAQIRNWIIDNVTDNIVVMADDDVVSCICMTGIATRKYTRPDDCYQILENAAFIAEGIGAGYFGFNQDGSPIHYNPTDPICFNHWVGTVCGVIGKDLHYDENLSLRDDYDFSMNQLLNKRIVYSDTRFFWESVGRLRSIGGNAAHRSGERERGEVNYLRQKWGQYMGFGALSSSTTAVTSRVSRRQK